ncbi:outer membrane protein assembly factor BamA [Alphaproteobacteria bacterium]|nr:outer membrane protein assembly factor BamA [Alphaproteobacteria bacterium]
MSLSFLFNRLALFLFVVLCFCGTLRAHVVTNVEVRGNERIEVDSIKAYVDYEKGRDYTPAVLDDALKKLLATGLFSDANLRLSGQKLVVTVQENPLVRHIVIEGNKGVEDDLVEKEMQLKPRRVFKVATLKSDVQKIKDIYRVRGFFAAQVTPQVIRRDQNRVDVIIDVKEGIAAKVRKIIFVGNKGFSDSTLEATLQTREEKWYRFFASDDTYDPDRLSLDQEKLRQHYLQHGYIDFYIKSAVAELGDDKKAFYLTFSVDEGKRHKVNKISVRSDVEGVEAVDVRSKVKLSEGGWYSSKDVESSITDMVSMLGDRGYAFTDVNPIVEKTPGKTSHVDVTFDLVKGTRAYIRHVLIKGNNRTDEDVIRRELRLHEGDAFHISKIKDSERRVKNLGFFKKVVISQSATEQADQVDLIVDIEEEQRTGELFIAGGYGSGQGFIAETGMREDNLFGRGQSLGTKFRFGAKTQDFDLNFTEPYFLDRRLAASVGLFHTREKNVDKSDFTEDNNGGRLGFAYELSEDLYQSWGYSLSVENVKGVDSTASRFMQEQRGRVTVSALSHKVTYDKLDSRVDPRNGYTMNVGNKLTGLGGNVRHHTHTLGAAYYMPLFTEDIILSFSGDAGYIQGLGKKVRIADRFALGGHQLRGFDFNGIGPRDKKTGDALRGTRIAHGSVEATFPLGLPKELGIRGAAFFDLGTIWRSGDVGAEVNENKGLRAGTGVGLMWKSPLGPLRFDFARAIRKRKGDDTRTFLFGYSSKM